MVKLRQLQFRDLVRQDLIVADVVFSDREDALRTMAGLLVDRGYCDEPYVEAVLDRERNHPSALPMAGYKIAIPHADSTYVNRSTLLFARLRKPVTFHSMGNPAETLPVSMISMFALKEKQMIGDLLETLLKVYQDEEVMKAIHGAGDATTIFEILRTNVDRKQAQPI